MSFEIFTMGGGEAMIRLFNGVAAIVGSDEWLTAVRIFGVIGFIVVIIAAIFTVPMREAAKWFVGFVLIFEALFVPKSTVIVVDRLQPALPGNVVANVPIGLAMFAGITSQVGDKLTEMVETAYSLPNDMKYQEHGMLFGSKLMRASTATRIMDSDFAGDIKSFTQQCIFYDLLQNRYSYDDFTSAPDLWEFLAAQPRSGLRSFECQTCGGDTIQTCDAGFTALDDQWNGQITKMTETLAMRAVPNASMAVAKSTVETTLSQSADWLMGMSNTAGEVLRQQAMINAVQDAADSWPGEVGIGAYSQARADRQTYLSQSLTAGIAEKWVPLLRTVVESIFYGVFPLMIFLFILPGGFVILKNYFGIFIWLQSWGPLYAILHTIMMLKGQSLTAAAAWLPNGSTTLSYATAGGVASVQADIANLAGYLSMSIPFLALAVAGGAQRFSGLATSMLATPQRAAEQAGAEAATGNFSIGNSHYGNHNFANVSGNKWDTSGMRRDGMAMSMQAHDGAMLHSFGDASTAYDSSTGVSNNATAGLAWTSSHTQQLSEAASRSLSEAQSNQISAAESQQRGFQSVFQAASSKGGSISLGEGATAEEQGRIQESMRTAQNIQEQIKNNYGFSDQEATRIAAMAAVEAQGGFKLFGNGATVTGRASTDTEKKQQATEAYDFALSGMKQLDASGGLDAIESYGRQARLNVTNSEGINQSEQVAANFNEASSYSQAATVKLDEAQAWQARVTEIEQNGFSQDVNLQNDYVDWLARQTDASGNVYGAHGASAFARAVPGSQTYDLNRDYQEQYMRQRMAQEKADALADYRERAGVTDEAGIRGNYAENAAAMSANLDAASDRAAVSDFAAGQVSALNDGQAGPQVSLGSVDRSLLEEVDRSNAGIAADIASNRATVEREFDSRSDQVQDGVDGNWFFQPGNDVSGKKLDLNDLAPPSRNSQSRDSEKDEAPSSQAKN